MNLIDLLPDLLTKEIFKRLAITDIIKVLLTNKSVYNNYLPKYQEELNDYKKDLWHRKTIAGPKYDKKLRLFKREVAKFFRLITNTVARTDFEQIIFVENRLVSVMNLDRFEKVSGRTVYGLSSFLSWWLIYVLDNRLSYVPNRLKFDTTGLNVTLDILLASLVSQPVGSNIYFYDLTILLLDRYTEIIHIPISINIVYHICREIDELHSIVTHYGVKNEDKTG